MTCMLVELGITLLFCSVYMSQFLWPDRASWVALACLLLFLIGLSPLPANIVRRRYQFPGRGWFDDEPFQEFAYVTLSPGQWRAVRLAIAAIASIVFTVIGTLVLGGWWVLGGLLLGGVLSWTGLLPPTQRARVLRTERFGE